MSKPTSAMERRIGILTTTCNRYEGIAYVVDSLEKKIGLARVCCYGTETRNDAIPLPPPGQHQDFIYLRFQDIIDVWEIVEGGVQKSINIDELMADTRFHVRKTPPSNVEPETVMVPVYKSVKRVTTKPLYDVELEAVEANAAMGTLPTTPMRNDDFVANSRNCIRGVTTARRGRRINGRRGRG